MKDFVRFALAAVCFLGIFPGIAAAQNLPPIDVFGGYSYLNFDQPASGTTPYEQLKMNGWDVSASLGLFHHFAAEADFSGHQAGNCGGLSGFDCKNFSYMFGPRFTIGDRSSRFTFFAHGLVGRDQATLLGLASASITDTSVAAGGGAGADYWLFRHVGLQFGPADYIYTNHLKDNGASGQGSFRVSGGIALRFGGDFPPPEPKAPKEPKEKSEGGHRSWIRPWHKSKPESSGEPSEAPVPPPAVHKKPPQPATVPATAPQASASRGMPIHPLGIVAAPQEFDGARILSIDPGSVAEMASLHVGDLVKAVNGKSVRTPMELAAELSDKSGKVRITFVRGKATTETEILLSTH